jgi:TolB-like protein
MGADSLNRVPGAFGAVFISYASQDAEAAMKICDALRVAGIEVWFDQSELRGGDAWDQRILGEIHDCALFVPLISLNTQKRLEGYFRHEWRLAIERTHHMAEQMPFLVPVVIDGTGDRDAVVPDAFRKVQWTRLPGGETPAAFVERVQRLLSHEPSTGRRPPSIPATAGLGTRATGIRASRRAAWIGAAVIVIGLIAFLVYEHPWTAPRSVSASSASQASRRDDEAIFHPPSHSVAVLPFVNLSGDATQDYFSDGLTEELLNSLAEIEGVQVAARTSSFSFKQHPDIVTVARQLNVATVLEGSVRRSEHTIRVTAQLINA